MLTLQTTLRERETDSSTFRSTRDIIFKRHLSKQHRFFTVRINLEISHPLLHPLIFLFLFFPPPPPKKNTFLALEREFRIVEYAYSKWKDDDDDDDLSPLISSFFFRFSSTRLGSLERDRHWKAKERNREEEGRRRISPFRPLSTTTITAAATPISLARESAPRNLPPRICIHKLLTSSFHFLPFMTV